MNRKDVDETLKEMQKRIKNGGARDGDSIMMGYKSAMWLHDTIKALLSDMDKVVDALELYGEIDGKRYVDEKDKRATERGLRRKVKKALADVERWR